MRACDFDYGLPEENIAIYPPAERGSTRMLVLNRASGDISHDRYASLANYLREGDLLVLNKTKVVRARLFARKPTGAKIELMLLEKHRDEQDLVLYRGKLKKGDRLLAHERELTVSEIPGEGIARITLSGDGSVRDFFGAWAEMPIPPYLKRGAEALDIERYQTVFAELPGSVAAPTASLNLTPVLLGEIEDKGVSLASLVLHVGLGTFLPVRVDNLGEHIMHREFYSIPEETIRTIRETKSRGGRVVAVGTTVTRALEHAGKRILDDMEPGPVSGEADIFIYPGYRFRVVDTLLTNFHAPRSTVLLLAAAFAGPHNLRKAYSEALDEGYRFLSYGDSMLIV
ncbi:MAG: tRNA preQ1(34) S-adenosylmethionine ribosyltransferase-isomerase QueA [Chlorobiaceae bacterium]|nr:tRNA preQ1(34) S-adenosylmethionine ribosyltransferase-isomerase QueA [Chlorobiaceae bacterium]NTV61698.1 tRNA preQ1(34) S-adenosylmethionine ribosyltransferase-isomerase QueA [Chlorobiaceae bacterium]